MLFLTVPDSSIVGVWVGFGFLCAVQYSRWSEIFQIIFHQDSLLIWSFIKKLLWTAIDYLGINVIKSFLDSKYCSFKQTCLMFVVLY